MTPPDPAPTVTDADRAAARAVVNEWYIECEECAARMVARIRAEAYRAGAEAALAAVQAENVEMFKLNSWARADAATALSYAREKLGLGGGR